MRYQLTIHTYAVIGHRMPDGKFWEAGFAGWREPYGECFNKKADAIAAAEKIDPLAVIDVAKFDLRRPGRDLAGWPQGATGWIVRVSDTHTGAAWKTIYNRFVPAELAQAA